ncbi:MAG: gamma-glutamyltransferase [Gemmatimonadetes bacterium]|nr:gamma-glutamyltransferase [Gemmatimonadota bacterium]
MSSGRSTVYAPNGVVATSQPLATGAGLHVLESGGTAADAIVAAAAVLNVTEPYMTGIGGDAFALVWSAAERRLVGLDASGRSGSLVDVDGLVAAGARGVPSTGARSVTVPGALAGWQALLERFGRMSLAQALEPAIRIAEEGFPVTPIIARDWAGMVDLLRADAGARATYLAGGRSPTAGAWFRNPDLARSLRAIADAGPSALYGGELGSRVVAGLRELGGWLTLDDLAGHEVRWVDPLSVTYRGYTLHELPPAGQGIAALQMLGMLESVDVAAMGHNSAAYLHTLIEAKKLAFADLAAHVADPACMAVPPAALLDAGYLIGRSKSIDARRAADRPEPGRFATHSETVYLAAADAEGNMVSFINSISGYFGSGVVVPGTGFALQNRGAGFTLEHGHPNRLAPKKRPFHTIIPAFVTRDGEPWLAFGVMGGPMQPQGHAQVLLNMLEFGMDVQQAIEAPRFRHLDGRSVAIERLDPNVARELGARGHELVPPEHTTFGGAQAVLRLSRGWGAGSDPRKDGMAAGH